MRLCCSGSLKPKYTCKTCGEDLWTEISDRTRGKEFLYTKDGRRHYRTRCNLSAEALDN